MISTSGCSCRNEAGSSVVIGPFTTCSTQDDLRSPVASSTTDLASRIVPIPIDSASAGTASGSPPNNSALLRLRFRLQRDAVRPRDKPAGRLIETNMPVGADPEDQQIDAAGALDRSFVTARFRDGIRRRPIEEIDPRGVDVHMIEEVTLHEAAIAARMRRRNTEELVQVEGGRLRKVRFPAPSEPHQLFVQQQRRSPGRESEHDGRLRAERIRHARREAPGNVIRTWEN